MQFAKVDGNQPVSKVIMLQQWVWWVLIIGEGVPIAYNRNIPSMWTCSSYPTFKMAFVPSIYMDIQVSYYWHPSYFVHVTPIVFWSSLANKLSAIWCVVCWIWVRFRFQTFSPLRRISNSAAEHCIAFARSWCYQFLKRCWQWFFLNGASNDFF